MTSPSTPVEGTVPYQCLKKIADYTRKVSCLKFNNADFTVFHKYIKENPNSFIIKKLRSDITDIGFHQSQLDEYDFTMMTGISGLFILRLNVSSRIVMVLLIGYTFV